MHTVWSKPYKTKSAATTAARNACKKAVDSPIYSPKEEVDYKVTAIPDFFEEKYKYALIGVCGEAAALKKGIRRYLSQEEKLSLGLI